MLTLEDKPALVKIASSMEEDEGGMSLGINLGTVSSAIGGGYGASSMRAILAEGLAALRSAPVVIANKAIAAGGSIADAARCAYNDPLAAASAVGSSLVDAAEAGAGKVKGGYAAIKAMLANAARFAAKYSPRL